MEQKFKPDKYEQQCHPVFQEAEFSNQVGHQKEQRTQTENGEYIGKEYDKRIAGNRKNSGNRVEGKNKIGKLNHNEHQKKRGKKQFSVLAEPELVTVVTRVYIYVCAHTQQGRSLLDVCAAGHVSRDPAPLLAVGGHSGGQTLGEWADGG